MMAKQTGSFDFNSVKSASQKATSFIFKTTGKDAWVCDENRGPQMSGTNAGEPYGPTAEYPTTGWRIGEVFEMVRIGVSWMKAWVENGVAKVRVGRADASHITLDSNGMDVSDGTDSVAAFGSTARVGKTNGPRTVIQNSGMDVYGESDGSVNLAHIGADFRIGSNSGYNISVADSGMEMYPSKALWYEYNGETIFYWGAANQAAPIENAQCIIFGKFRETSSYKSVRIGANHFGSGQNALFLSVGTESISLDEAGNSAFPGDINASGTIKQNNTAVSLNGHSHAAGDITSGTLGIARGGTGATTAAAAWTALGGGSIGKKNSLSTSDVTGLEDSGWQTLANTNSTIKYRKHHGVVYVVGISNGSVTISQGGTAVGTLPTGYRPSIPIGGAATTCVTTSPQTGQFYINSDNGIITVYNLNGTNAYWRFSVAFPV